MDFENRHIYYTHFTPKFSILFKKLIEHFFKQTLFFLFMRGIYNLMFWDSYNATETQLTNANDKIMKKENENWFKGMGFTGFWTVSNVLWFSFPVSLALCCFVFDSVRTKQLVKALAHDFLQAFFIMLAVICVIIYSIYHFVSAPF